MPRMRACLLLLSILLLSAAPAQAQVSPVSTPESSPTPNPSPPVTQPSAIAFTSGRTCADETGRCNRDVFAMNPAATGSPTPLAPFPGVDDDPSISPDGRLIVFSSDRVCDPDGDGENTPGCKQNRDIYLIGADGRGLVRLTEDPAAEHRPRWSPLGGSVVFHRTRSNGRADIVVKNVDRTPSTSDPEFELTKGERDYQPSFSPSGHQVAFTRVTLPDDPPQEGGTIDPETVGANIYVYDFCSPEPLFGPIGDQPAHPDFDQTPTWRPDPTALEFHNPCEWDWRQSGELAFGSLRDCADPVSGLAGQAVPGCSYELYKMPADAGDVVNPMDEPDRLTTDTECSSVPAEGPQPEGTTNCPQDLDPSYSPDGSRMVFWSDRPEGAAQPTARRGSSWPTTGPTAVVRRYLRRNLRSFRQFPPPSSLQAAEDNDVYVFSAALGMAGGMTNLTPDGDKGDAEKYDDMAPSWGVALRSGGGGGGGGGSGPGVVPVEVVKFEDLDADGRRDQGEPPLAGVRFFADVDRDGRADPGEATGTTGQDGRALLTVVANPSVRVIEVSPDGFVCTMPTPCFYDVVLVNPPAPLVFGNTRLAGGGGEPPPTRCAASAGFRSVSLAPRAGGRLRIGFRRRLAQPVAADVFQVSSGRTIDRRRVARFRDRKRSFTWSGVGRGGRPLSDGFYIVRYRIAGLRGTDVRRVPLRRIGGRFATVPAYQRRPRCRAVKRLHLSLPVFGGRGSRPLRFAYELNRPARVRVTVRRGNRVVRRYRVVRRDRGTTFRGRLAAAGLAPGRYRVKVVATAPGRPTHRVSAVAQRL